MKHESEVPSASTAVQLVDEVIEKQMTYLTRTKEPEHVTALETMVADLRQVKLVLRAFEKKEAVEQATSLELCNHLFVRMLKRLKKAHKQSPFSIYKIQLNLRSNFYDYRSNFKDVSSWYGYQAT